MVMNTIAIASGALATTAAMVTGTNGNRCDIYNISTAIFQSKQPIIATRFFFPEVQWLVVTNLKKSKLVAKSKSEFAITINVSPLRTQCSKPKYNIWQ